MAVASSPQSLDTLGRLYQEDIVGDFEPMEHLREVGCNLLRRVGLHAGTKPLAELCVAITRAKAMVHLNATTPDLRITLETVVPGMSSKQGLVELTSLLSVDEKRRMERDLQKASMTMSDWMWSTKLDEELYQVCFDADLLVNDAQWILSADLARCGGGH